MKRKLHIRYPFSLAAVAAILLTSSCASTLVPPGLLTQPNQPDPFKQQELEIAKKTLDFEQVDKLYAERLNRSSQSALGKLGIKINEVGIRKDWANFYAQNNRCDKALPLYKEAFNEREKSVLEKGLDQMRAATGNSDNATDDFLLCTLEKSGSKEFIQLAIELNQLGNPEKIDSYERLVFNDRLVRSTLNFINTKFTQQEIELFLESMRNKILSLEGDGSVLFKNTGLNQVRDILSSSFDAIKKSDLFVLDPIIYDKKEREYLTVQSEKEKELLNSGGTGRGFVLSTYYTELARSGNLKELQRSQTQDFQLLLETNSPISAQFTTESKLALMNSALLLSCKQGNIEHATFILKSISALMMSTVESALAKTVQSGNPFLAVLSRGQFRSYFQSQLNYLKCFENNGSTLSPDQAHQINSTFKILSTAIDDLASGVIASASKNWRGRYTELKLKLDELYLTHLQSRSRDSYEAYLRASVDLKNFASTASAESSVQTYVRDWANRVSSALKNLQYGLSTPDGTMLISMLSHPENELASAYILVYRPGKSLPQVIKINSKKATKDSINLRGLINNQVRSTLLNKAAEDLLNTLGLKELEFEFSTSSDVVYIEGGGVLETLPLDFLMQRNKKEALQSIVYLDSLLPLADSENKIENTMKLNLERATSTVLANPSYGVTNANSQSREVLRSLVGEVFQPLPETIQEAEIVSKLTRQSEVLSLDTATKTNFLSAITNKTVVHVASHAFFKSELQKTSFEARSGATSGIALAGANTAPSNLLFLAEISEQPLLNTKLVVLSACRTALGSEQLGSQMRSLRYSFSRGGERAVISTLWDIPSKPSVLFMEYFYKSLADNGNIEIALKTAKQKMISSKKYSHPIYWAGFTLSI